MISRNGLRLLLVGVILSAAAGLGRASSVPPEVTAGPTKLSFPRPLTQYDDGDAHGVLQVLRHRATQEPFNVVATVIFLLAITHTFFAHKFTKIAHHWRDEHQRTIEEEGRTAEDKPQVDAQPDVSWKVVVMHFLGEVEAIFGIWVLPLLIAITIYRGWGTAENYISHGVNFTEPMFVVVVMTIASTRPVLRFAEQVMRMLASLGGRSPSAWWFSILTVGPLLGSFITEPAAMTISALLLARQFYDLKPGRKFRYATLGLLFVNVSIGGTLTHFAAPPVLMVASRWGWDTPHMIENFGWKAMAAILCANTIYFFFFRSEFARMQRPERDQSRPQRWSDRTDSVPIGVTLLHLFFLGWTVFTAHYPALFIGGFLFFLAATAATEHHQNPINLKPALLVGFFLAGLVIHGGFQGWWIAPVLASMSEVPLMLTATTLTAFNDNAAITYLASLVPNFSDGLKYAVMAGAVAGGGLTVIANAPNPAGQSILSRYFDDGISALWLAVGALLPTAIVLFFFLFFA
ncbi:MAG: putative Na+/H+ antiporter [Chthoniobacterales bacterium]